MGLMSRTKGKVGERELAKLLTSEGFTARRGVQFQGSTDSPDVVCEVLPRVHFEVKRCEALSVYRALEQARTDAGEKMPIVAHRRNDCDWVAILSMRDLLQLLRESSQLVQVVNELIREEGLPDDHFA